MFESVCVCVFSYKSCLPPIFAFSPSFSSSLCVILLSCYVLGLFSLLCSMFHNHVSPSSSVSGAAHGQHFDDDTPPQRAPAGWSFTGVKLSVGGWKIPTEERDNSRGRPISSQKLMIGNMLRNRAHFTDRGDFSNKTRPILQPYN